jgi:hypothetical protein
MFLMFLLLFLVRSVLFCLIVDVCIRADSIIGYCPLSSARKQTKYLIELFITGC